ncbi:hypothetical protein [Phaeodactylibacter luteus]|nr:hypothetical protein [Phaeodactylibacter luteus]
MKRKLKSPDSGFAIREEIPKGYSQASLHDSTPKQLEKTIFGE